MELAKNGKAPIESKTTSGVTTVEITAAAAAAAAGSIAPEGYRSYTYKVSRAGEPGTPPPELISGVDVERLDNELAAFVATSADF